LIRRLCVIGVGLIGGSLALALRRAGVVGEIVGVGRHEAHLRKAVELGVIDRYELDLARAPAGADLVVLAAPLGAIQTICAAIRDQLDTEVVLTDVGSAKQVVVDAVRLAFGEVPANFVPGHPIAGTERSGVEAAFPDLYQGHRVILTPQPGTASNAVRIVTSMWHATGAVVEEMDTARHDQVFAATSHLPHLLAFALVDSLADLDEREEVFRYAAGGFRDFTRIASSDPVMWRDICLANSDDIVAMTSRYRNVFKRIEDAVRRRDGRELLEIFTHAKRARDRFVAH
jgi:prephenate dehydrogenase